MIDIQVKETVSPDPPPPPGDRKIYCIGILYNMIDIRVKETVSPDPQPQGDRIIYRYTT